MPELPEVETIRLGLQKYLVGKTIVDVEVRLKKIISGDTKSIIGGKVINVRRFGKGLVIDLDNDYSITIHIMLTGQLIYQDEKVSKVSKVSKVKVGTLPNKFTHVIFKLKSKSFDPSTKLRAQDKNAKVNPSTLRQNSGLRTRMQKSKVKNEEALLYYNDIRQFGWIKIIKADEVSELPFFKDLGPEPLSNLTMKQFNNIVSFSNTAIKSLIMDQKKMSGIGNIYANDALFDAAIDPRRKAKSLKQEEIKKLFASILKVLKIGLENGGASELNYVNALGQEGKYQHHFLVYGRENEPCKVCGSKIQKIKLAGRGTYFCNKCQK